MKKTIFLLLTLFSLIIVKAQQSENLLCGTDEIMRKHYERHPEEKAKDDAFNLELSQLVKSGKLQTKLDNTNEIYEIPIVVHVVSDGSAVGSINNRSDADIIAWINYTNNVFAASSSSSMNASSSVLPVKFVFAQVSPNCTPTSGINRIDASHLPKYVSGGVNNDNTTNAIAASEITSIAMWDTSKYYNIYIVKKLASNSGGLNGFAYYPGGSNDYSIMATSASSVNSQTLAHEFGHALGLRHTHEGYNETTGSCPINTDCTIQGDFVCDTEPMKSLYHSSIPNTCQDGQINPCTNALYSGGEKNIMAYTYCFRDRFTAGQTTRAISQLLYYRQSLINSPVINSTSIDNSTILTPSCTPSNITNPGNYNIGITSVKFGSINNYSPNYKLSFNNFYENYTSNYCLGVSKTSIPLNSTTTITVEPGTSNPHIIKAYIDYNNDGQFNESTELILNQSGITYGSTATASVTPPTSAVTNIPLKMRVIGDYNGSTITACYIPKYGQVEDYSVIIESSSLATQDNSKAKATYITKYENNVIVKSNQNISAIEIYDPSGRLLFNKKNILSKEFSTLIVSKNTVIIVNVLLEGGEEIKQKIKF